MTFVAACWLFALALASNTCSQATNRDYLSSMRLCCDNFRWSSILLRRFEVAVEVSSMKSLVALRLQIREYLVPMGLCGLWFLKFSLLRNSPSLNSDFTLSVKVSPQRESPPIFMASEQGLDASTLTRAFKPPRLKSQI